MGLVLGLIGAWLGSSSAFGFGATWGWFIGSTLGSLLSLGTEHEYTAANRLVDFRYYSSKYGLPIARGYGCSRYSGNMIWSGPIIESQEISTQCVKSGGFFGIGGSRKCVHNTTYHYQQSAAIAFCEGPAASIQRIWGDGELMWEKGTADPERIRSVTTYRGAENPYNPFNNSPIRVYLGTLTQKPDYLIKKWLGPENSESGLDEAYAFRSIVYIMLDNLDLEVYGYRLPTFTAEVCFSSNDDVVTRTLETPSVAPTYGSQRLGVIPGHPNLVAGNALKQRRAIWDVVTQELLFESTTNEPQDFTGAYHFEMLSPQFFSIRHYYPFGNESWTGPYDFITGRQLYFTYNTFYDLVGNGQAIYDPVQNAFWHLAFLTGEMQYFPLYHEPLPATRAVLDGTYVSTSANIESAEGLKALSFEGDETGYESGLMFRSGRQLPEEWWIQTSDPGGLSGKPTNIHMMRDGKVIWGCSSSALSNSWIMISWLKNTNIFPERAQQKAYKLKFHDGVDVVYFRQFAYIAQDDSIVIDTDYSSTATPPHPDGQYKVFISEFDDENNEILLPNPSTEGRYLNIITFSDPSAWQRGDTGGGIVAAHTNPPGGGLENYTFFDFINMEARHVWFENLPSIFSSTLYYPQLNASVARPNAVIFWGGIDDTVLLSTIVDDLMTKVDGDDLLRLISSDIDVSELTDEVRGFSITQQQTIRSAIAQLMQGFFFDAVESDGIIKFKKRGRSATFSIPENDMQAGEYGAVKRENSSLVYERRSEGELPRELVVQYPDIDNDFLSNTQRARRTEAESESNITLPLEIVFNKDEAAQVADVLLYDAWQEKNANFEFSISQKHITVEPGDVGTLTMNDGKTHRVRIVSVTVGKNNVSSCVAVEDFANSYVSAASGIGSNVEENTITNVFVMPVLLDVTTRFVKFPMEGPAIVGGVTSLGSTFDGGKLFVRDKDNNYLLAGVKAEGNAVAWASVDEEIGHPNNFIDTDEFDTETVISMSLVGGTMPVSGTTDEALNGERLMLIDNEIVGYTTVTPIDGRRFTVSNLLRGLYGTQHSTYHRYGARVYFPEELFATSIDPPEIDGQIFGFAQGIFGGQKVDGTTTYQANNVIPWNPTNMGYSSGKITWDRMDRIYSDGIDPAIPDDIVETSEKYVIRHIDHNTPGEEGKILTQVESTTSNTSAITVPSSPILVDVHQTNEYGLSYPLREVVSSSGSYSGGGSTVDAGITRWGASNSYVTPLSEGPFAGVSVRVFPYIFNSGVKGWEMPTGACKNIEILTRVYPSNYVRWTHGQQCGIYLRGSGDSVVNAAATIGVGGPNAENFTLDLYQNGKHTAVGINPPYDDKIDYDWDEPNFTYGRRFWIRGRFYGSRIQAKIWEDGETEPSSWQLNAYDDTFGPYFGSCGFFTLDGTICSDYFSWAHRGGTAA